MTSALANLVPGPYRAPTLRRFPDDFLNPVPPSNTPQDVSHYPISSRAPPHTPHHTTGIEPSWDTNIQIAPLSCCDRVRTTTPPCTVTLLDVTKHVMALPPPTQSTPQTEKAHPQRPSPRPHPPSQHSNRRRSQARLPSTS